MKKVKILCALIGSLLCQFYYHRENTMAILFYVFINQNNLMIVIKSKFYKV